MLSLACLASIQAYAKTDITIDGNILVHKEYNDTVAALQLESNESNSNVTLAYLHWASSPEDNSIYLGIMYETSDFEPDGGKTAVEITVNGELCGTVHPNEPVTDLNTNLFFVESQYRIQPETPAGFDCEIRVGIKYWPDGAIEVGLRIFDCSGIPSNYRRQIVHSPAPELQTTTTTKPTTERSTTEKATTKKATTDKTTNEKTTAAPKTTSAAAASSTTAAEKKAETTTHPTVPDPRTAVAELQKMTTTQTSQTTQTIVQTKAAAAAGKKSAAAKSSKAAQASSKKETRKETSTTTAAAVVSETVPTDTAAAETSASVTCETTQTFAEQYSAAGKIKFVGSILVAVLLTSAAFISVFAGYGRNRADKEPEPTPQEEHEDFG